MPRSKGFIVFFWVVTALFCLQMGFTAYAELRLPQVAAAFIHLGFPAYSPCRALVGKASRAARSSSSRPCLHGSRSRAYAGFAIDLASAVIAHVAVGDGPEAWGWAVGTAVLWALSYLGWRRLEAV